MAYQVDGVKYEEDFIDNSRGMKLFTCSWVPENSESKALIFLCHPYALQCNIAMREAGIRLAKAGFAVHGMDFEGHGKSSGLQGFIPCFDNLVNDCSHHFTSICEEKENMMKPRFLFGQLMGGGVAILLHWKMPTFWDGAILLTPLCKWSDKLKLHPLIMQSIEKLCGIIPTWSILPATPPEVCFRNPQAREQFRSNPYFFTGRPRLQSFFQGYKMATDIEQRLQEVSLPFFVVHGEDDKVSDPNASKLLYESASSKDKTIKIYPGMWHHLLFGELPENIETMLSDIVAWLDNRVTSMTKSRLELI